MRAGALGDVHAVGHEQEVKPRLLGQLRLLFVETEVHAGIDHRVGVAPVAPARAHAVQDKAEDQLAGEG